MSVKKKINNSNYSFEVLFEEPKPQEPPLEIMSIDYYRQSSQRISEADRSREILKVKEVIKPNTFIDSFSAVKFQEQSLMISPDTIEANFLTVWNLIDDYSLLELMNLKYKLAQNDFVSRILLPNL